MWPGKEMGWVEVSKASKPSKADKGGSKRDLPLENNKKITDWTNVAVVGATKNPEQMNSELKFEVQKNSEPNVTSVKQSSKKAWTKLKNGLFGWRVVKKGGWRTEQTSAQVGSEQVPQSASAGIFPMKWVPTSVDNLSTDSNNEGKKVKVMERKYSSNLVGTEPRTGDTSISGSDTDLDIIEEIRTKRPKLVLE